MEPNSIQIEGLALDRKGGAVVEVGTRHYWIMGVHSWDDEYLNQTVCVEGILSVYTDPAIFIIKEDEPIKQGVGYTELEASLLSDNAKNKYSIKDAKVTLKA
ncbi:MAG: hypothetical protein GY810_12980 [Aureispira sp.]|nr:hypothetical protein [Aureispira sp.]